MKTRTLLLLSVVTGLAILVAGGIQLIRVTGQEAGIPNSRLGEPVQVADMEVTVEDVTVNGEALSVALTIGGVDDPDAAGGFTLVAPDAGVLAPVAPDGTAPGGTPICAATTVAPQRCELVFDVSGAGGGSRALRYERGDERARWQLPTD